MEQEKILDIDLIAKKIVKIYIPLTFAIGFSVTIALSFIPSIGMSTKLKIFDISAMIVMFLLAPSYVVLKKSKCPYCNDNYFVPKICFYSKFLKTIKESEHCVSCGKKARIISKYLNLM